VIGDVLSGQPPAVRPPPEPGTGAPAPYDPNVPPY